MEQAVRYRYGCKKKVVDAKILRNLLLLHSKIRSILNLPNITMRHHLQSIQRFCLFFAQHATKNRSFLYSQRKHMKLFAFTKKTQENSCTTKQNDPTHLKTV